MPFDYEREVRTASSDAYLIMDNGTTVGRIDNHYLPGRAHITIAVDSQVMPDQLDEILRHLGDAILNTIGHQRDMHLYHIYQGTEIQCFNTAADDSYDGGNGHGHGPLPPAGGI